MAANHGAQSCGVDKVPRGIAFNWHILLLETNNDLIVNVFKVNETTVVDEGGFVLLCEVIQPVVEGFPHEVQLARVE